jgi:hypothetical protein
VEEESRDSGFFLFITLVVRRGKSGAIKIRQGKAAGNTTALS